MVILVTVRKRSCGKVMFLHLSVSHSLHGGRGVSPLVHAGQTLPSRHPRADTPYGQIPLGRHPPADGYYCGRCTSYWNAFLLIYIINLIGRKSHFEKARLREHLYT